MKFSSGVRILILTCLLFICLNYAFPYLIMLLLWFFSDHRC